MISLSVIILTKDEEANLPYALESLKPLGAKIYIVDSGSTDRTRAIAERHGCIVLANPFTTHAKQINWALDNLPIETEWVLRLDADEWLTPELVAELARKLPTLPPDITGLMLKRRVYFWGRWIRHGGYYPTWLLRVWRRGAARCEDRDMDEHMLITNGHIGDLEHDLVDENHKGLAFWIDKHNRYSDKEVTALRTGTVHTHATEVGASVARKRKLKNGLYGRAPRFLRAFLYWAFRYVLQLGFLDGKAGFVFHFLQGFWYRLVVDAKLEEAERGADFTQAGRPEEKR
ncbi:MAG: hypothetical protein RJB62_3 [Pseudomonadota bacterium]|jgi:glycosyltransferase involved in cell wall biosynthesis